MICGTHILQSILQRAALPPSIKRLIDKAWGRLCAIVISGRRTRLVHASHSESGSRLISSFQDLYSVTCLSLPLTKILVRPAELTSEFLKI